jgi:hypothetical protein
VCKCIFDIEYNTFPNLLSYCFCFKTCLRQFKCLPDLGLGLLFVHTHMYIFNLMKGSESSFLGLRCTQLRQSVINVLETVLEIFLVTSIEKNGTTTFCSHINYKGQIFPLKTVVINNIIFWSNSETIWWILSMGRYSTSLSWRCLGDGVSW